MTPRPLPNIEPESKTVIRWIVAGICIGLILAIFAPVIAQWLAAQDGSEMRVAQELEHVIREEQSEAKREEAALAMCRDVQKSDVAVSELENGTYFCSTKRGLNVTRISI